MLFGRLKLDLSWSTMRNDPSESHDWQTEVWNNCRALITADKNEDGSESFYAEFCDSESEYSEIGRYSSLNKAMTACEGYLLEIVYDQDVYLPYLMIDKDYIDELIGHIK